MNCMLICQQINVCIYLIILLKHYQILQKFEMNCQNISKYDFIQRSEHLFAMPIPVSLRMMLNYCEMQIYTDFGTAVKFDTNKEKCGSLLASVYKQAVKMMNKQERLSYYWFVTDCVFKIANGKKQQLSVNKIKQFKKQAYVCVYGNKFQKLIIQSTHASHTLNIIPALKPPIYIDLSLYMCRKSKNDHYFALVLNACDPRVSKGLRKIVIGFKDQKQFQEIYEAISLTIRHQTSENIKAAYQGDPLTRGILTQIEVTQNQFKKQSAQQAQIFYSCREIGEQQMMTISDGQYKKTQSIEDLNLVESNQSQYAKLQLQACAISKILHLNKWVIQQKLKLIESNYNGFWQILAQNHNFTLSKNNDNELLLEVYSQDKNINELYEIIRQMPSYQIKQLKQINKNNNLSTYEMQFKNNQNSYQVQPLVYGRLVHHEDDKMIIFHQYPIVQGSQTYQAIWQISSKLNKIKELRLLMSMRVISISRQNNLKLGIKYLKGVFQRIHYANYFFSQTELRIDQKLNQLKMINMNNINRYQTRPLPSNIHQLITGVCFQKVIGSDWMKDEQQGGLQYLDKDKIAAQKSVIKHILKQMGKNILSGKSILNMSLPVHIFSIESHLQRLIHSFRLAPLLFDKVAAFQKQNMSTEDTLYLLNLACIFGITTSLLYLSQQKSFNPILGETCQMWIDGCPVYGEQILHHPPISALYFVGRGYRIYAQLQAKVELGLNTGKGSNDGKVTIQFDNGVTIQNYFAAGEVSGLSYGKRKFNMVNKSYHFVKSAGILLEVDYSSKQTKSKNLDHYSGQFYEIDAAELNSFKATRKFKSRKSMKAVESKTKVQGIWNEIMVMKENQFLNIKDMCLKQMSRDKQPLPSDSIWRQDIYYRKLQNMEKAQDSKQQLQESQRRDRKLRQLSVR